MFRAFAVTLLLALFAHAAVAQDGSHGITVDSAGRLAVGGIVLLQLRDKSVCESVAQRADQITSRLVNALERIHSRARFSKIRVTVEPPAANEPPGEPWVAVEGVRLFKVTYQDVAAAKRPADELATMYANQVRRALRRIYLP